MNDPRRYTHRELEALYCEHLQQLQGSKGKGMAIATNWEVEFGAECYLVIPYSWREPDTGWQEDVLKIPL